MGDTGIIIDIGKGEEPESDELVIVGEAEAYEIRNNVYYRIEHGNKYNHIWHNNRRLKIEEAVQAEEEKDTDFYYCGVSDDPYSVEDYNCNTSPKGKMYCRPFDREVKKVNVAPDLIGKLWDEEALAYLECVGPKFLSVYHPHKGGTLAPHNWELGEVQVTVDETGKIISVVKNTNIGLAYE